MNQTNRAISKVQNILNHCFLFPCFFLQVKTQLREVVLKARLKHSSMLLSSHLFFRHQARDSRSWVFTAKLQIKFYDRYPAEVQVQKGF